MFLGVHLCLPTDDNPREYAFGCSINDGYYSTDFAVMTVIIPEYISESQYKDLMTQNILRQIKQYSKKLLYKFVAIGLSESATRFCPDLCSKLWMELDILPFVFHSEAILDNDADVTDYHPSCDEVADSLVRKTVMFFGPKGLPRMSIGYRNKVEVDSNGMIRMVDLRDYESICRPETWGCLMKLVKSIRECKIGERTGARIAFFNATPQGLDIIIGMSGNNY